jgi:hypothetical protein
MPRRPKRQHIGDVIERLIESLKCIEASGLDGDLRSVVLRLVPVHHAARDLGVSAASRFGIEGASAFERIRVYLVQNEGRPVSGDELQVVSGISEYARRVRELRVEHGYLIVSGSSKSADAGVDLSPDEYLLVSAQPDQDAARRWKIANRIRQMPGSATDRLFAFLKENVGFVVTTEELAYVAKDARSFARRVRELRTEQGFIISTKFSGRPDLRVGQYVLETLDRRVEPHDRRVENEVERAVYARDASRCRACGWSRQDASVNSPRYLELHHLTPHASGGANSVENLLVLCSKCHDEVHAARLVPVEVNGVVVFERAELPE